MAVDICTQNRELLTQYRQVLGQLQEAQEKFERAYEVLDLNIVLLSAEAELCRLHRDFYDHIAYQHNHAVALANKGVVANEYVIPEKPPLHIQELVRTDIHGEKTYYNIFGEPVREYQAVHGNFLQGAAFGQVNTRTFHLLNPAGGRIGAEEFPAPQTGFVNGVAVVESKYSLSPYLVSRTGQYLTPPDTYTRMKLYEHGFVEASCRDGSGYDILNAAGEVTVHVDSVIDLSWGVAYVLIDNRSHYIDLETGRPILSIPA